MRNVTIIIPVYKDWNTLNLCIESLKEFVDSRHTIMLVNDMSSESEVLEEKILASISGHSNFVYYRNPYNMGFVKTCNRAVFELDKTENDILLLNSDTKVTENFLEEMLEVLYLAEKHGVVCPRSNCATLCTVPVRTNDDRNILPDESFSCWSKIKNSLPRYAVIPTGVGFCFLVKRNVISLYGLFDEVYGLGYNEENDFCMRISQYGWNVVLANKSFVFHYESKSFGSKKSELEIEHHKILMERYPYYESIVNSYFSKRMNSVDYFADVLSEFYEKKRVLISLYNLPPLFNGTAAYGLEFLKNFISNFHEKYDICILTNREADEFHGLSKKYPNVYFPDTIRGGFDIAYIPSQIFHAEHLFILNRTCLRFVFCMQDIITLRCNYLLAQNFENEDIFRQSIQFADGVVGISDFTIHDTKAYFPELFSERSIPFRKIYHASDKNIAVETAPLPFESYFLVFGNKFKHKMLNEIMEILKESKFHFIVLGASVNGKINSNIYGYQSGFISDGFINALYKNCSGVVFPSVYEGFGLPILSAVEFGKKIIVNDNQLNKELFCECIKFYDENVFFYSKLEELPVILEKINSSPRITTTSLLQSERTTVDVAKETEKFLSEILKAPIDLKRLQMRWEYYHYLENVHRCYCPTVYVKMSFFGMLRKFVKKIPFAYRILKKLKTIIMG